MNRLKFFKGLSIGLCLSAMMWWGMYKAVDTVIDIESVNNVQNLQNQHMDFVCADFVH